jgi:AraC family transcriptional activator of pobA
VRLVLSGQSFLIWINFAVRPWRARTVPTTMPTTSGEARIPRFYLYGDAGLVRDAEFFHIEDIKSRSERYDWEIGSHTHPGLYQLVFFLEGGGEVALDEARLQVASPAAVAIPPGVVHAFRFVPGTRGYVLTLAEAMLFDSTRQAGQLFDETLFRRPTLLRLEEQGEATCQLGHLLDQLQAEFRGAEAGRVQMVEWLVWSVLMLLARRQMSATGDANPAEQARSELFSRFRGLVEVHYTQHWTVAQYAGQLHTSESTLNRVVREVAGCSAFELVQDRVVLEARRKLTYIAAPVSRLAYELGFQDPAYFCRFFRKRTGMTPSEFRRRRTPAQLSSAP